MFKRLGVELCVHRRSMCQKASDDRMPRPWCSALLFSRLLLFRRHCKVIKYVSPCQRDLNLPNGFYCLIQHKFSWRVIKGKYLNDLISHKSVSVVLSYFSYFLVPPFSSKVFICRPFFFFFFKHELKGISFIPLTPFGRQQWCSNRKLTVFAWQVRPRPRDLLVRLHRRAGLPERQGYPAQRLLPDGHRHPAPCQPAGPNAAARAGIKEKRRGRKKKKRRATQRKKLKGWMEGKRA